VGALVRVVDGRLAGVRGVGGGAQRFEAPWPEGALLGEMAEAALWLLDLRVGGGFEATTVEVDTGRPGTLAVEVLGRESLTVPAGTFEALRVRVRGPRGPRLLWLRAASPHITLRVVTPGRAESLDLVEGPLPPGSGGP